MDRPVERSRECWRDCGTVFGAAVVDRTERLADEEVRAAVVFRPLFATASGLARER